MEIFDSQNILRLCYVVARKITNLGYLYPPKKAIFGLFTGLHVALRGDRNFYMTPKIFSDHKIDKVYEKF